MNKPKLWIRLYIELLDDPKIAKLSDSLYRLAVELWLLAGEVNKEGEIPNIKDLAWRLRRQEDDSIALIDQLKEAGVVIERRKKLIVYGWKERQAPLTARDRKRIQRWRDGVTNRDTVVTKDTDNSDYIKKEIKSKKRGEKTLSPKNLTKYFGGMK